MAEDNSRETQTPRGTAGERELPDSPGHARVARPIASPATRRIVHHDRINRNTRIDSTPSSSFHTPSTRESVISVGRKRGGSKARARSVP